MKFFRTAACLAACVALAGCFQMDQSLTVRTDGHAEFRVAYGVEAGVLQMSETSTDDFCGDPKDIPSGLTATSETYAEGSLRMCEVVISGPLDAIAEHVNREQPILGDSENNGAEAAGFSLTESNGVYRYRAVMEFDVGDADTDPEQREMMKNMMVAMSAGRALEFSVTAPQIVSTNGRTSSDGTKATLSVPLAEVFSGSVTSAEFEAEFRL